MSRRFSNLQYISIGILFGTCVFLWTRKLNLTKTFPSNATGNLRQVARNEDERRLIDSWANRIEDDESTNFEDGEEIAINKQEEISNDQIGLRPKEAVVLDNEAFSMNSPNTSQEVVEEVVNMGSSKTNSDETFDKTQSPEPVESVSETVDTQTENTVYSEDNSSVSSATSDEMSSSISTTTNSVINPPLPLN